MLVLCTKVEPWASKGPIFSFQDPGLFRPPHKWLSLLLYKNLEAPLQGRSLPGFSKPQKKNQAVQTSETNTAFLDPRVFEDLYSVNI